MAKTQTLEWRPFFSGHVIEKMSRPSIVVVTEDGNRPKGMPSRIMGFAIVTIAAAAIGSTLLPHLTGAEPAALPAMANGVDEGLSRALEPVKRMIFSFAHEIYFVMMAWGGLEALIGRFQQGFARMKMATLAYVVLFWVPWIVGQVNKVVPTSGW